VCPSHPVKEVLVFPRSRVLTAITAVAAAGSLALTGCSSNSETGGSPTGKVSASITKDATIAAMVPAKIKSAGKLVIGVNPPYAPNEIVQNGKVVGFDVDLLDATAKVLGLTTDYRQADFDKIIPAIQAGTYDMGMSSFTDTKEREQSVDFVTYFSAGILWAAPKGKTVDPDNACGLKVAVQTTTVEDTDDVPNRSKKCTDAGKPAIQKVQFESQDDATNAVILGKVDAMSADSPVTAYAIKQSGGKLQQAGQIFDSAPYGWPVPKGSELGSALQKALQNLIDSGAYDQICKKWGVQTGEIKTSKINDAQS
jgi:polar amino acid transport system substrate-binding protein